MYQFNAKEIKDGKLLVEQNLQQVRAKLHNGNF